MSLVIDYYQQLVDLPAAQNTCSLIGLPKLASYWPAIMAIAVFFQVLRLSSNTLSSCLFGKKFDVLTPRQKYDWGVRVVSQVHAVSVVILSVPILFKEELIKDPLYGFDAYSAWVYSIKPSLQYYGASFIMFETSTIFLNINWWMDKLGLTGSRLQFYNASALLFLYLTIRIMFGTYMSYHMFEDLKAKGSQTPAVLYYFYRIANHSILVLSYYWFYLMINAVRKRFQPAKTKAD
ncbi:hypothetical protein LPJ59_000522 [Coemansia sp. RSA 2399]|nr:hypothetical protein LPJ59_000522 [Coemansia sp. RSA 2399]KAJ1907941.1 hypothetical protein LPJ81_000435 [Coemansia sp. IMI 209127]